MFPFLLLLFALNLCGFVAVLALQLALRARVRAGELRFVGLEAWVHRLAAQPPAAFARESGVQAEPRPEPAPAPAPTEPASFQPAPGLEEVASALPPSLFETATQPAVTPQFAKVVDEPSSTDAASTPLPLPSSTSPRVGIPEPRRPVNWEEFFGARLFAWLGGLALFLAVAYFVKYSFDHNLIPPSARVAIGLAAGVALLTVGVTLRRRIYRVTSQTMCGTGVLVLYASLYAGHGYYKLPWLPQLWTFALMTAVTAVAFFLAVRMRALVIAVLGMVGGFLTPLLLSTGEDQTGVLFTYLGLLDAGLIAVALRRRWPFLTVLGAVATAILQIGWAARFFSPDRVGVALVIFSAFPALFLVGMEVARRWNRVNDWLSSAVAVSAFMTLGFAGWVMSFTQLAAEPWKVFSFVLVADLALLTVAWWRERLSGLHLATGVLVFGYLIVWMANSLTPSLLGWGLGLSVAFAVLHSAFPLVLDRFKPVPGGSKSAQFFPPLALAVLTIPLLKLETPSFAIWPVIVLINLLALALTTWASGLAGAFIALLLSGLATAVWIGRLPTDIAELGGTLFIVAAMAALFAGAGAAMLRRGRGSSGEGGTGAGVRDDPLRLQIPVCATLLPFLLLTQLVVQLRLQNPTPLLLTAAVILGMLFALAVWLRMGMLPLGGLIGLALLEHAWWLQGIEIGQPVALLGWYVIFHLAFAALPWLARERLGNQELPWIAAALAGVAQFHVAYRLIDQVWPNDAMGLVPLAFGIPAAATLWGLARTMPAGHPERARRLAWLGGATLFFITVAIPIQFDHQWLTLGLVLEGAALVWLHRRVPHPGLLTVGLGLMGSVFIRLILNPYVFEYATRGPVPLWNWWFYTYGIAAAAFFAAAVWVRDGVWNWAGVGGPLRAKAALVTGGTILLFALVNLEIADFFTPVGDRVRFEFSGDFGRDMTYTIAWAIFALGLVIAGLRRRLVGPRWAGLGLLGVAAAKLFLHDLARLDQLYRIGALAGVAFVAIAASVLYQRFVARDDDGPEPGPEPEPTRGQM